MATANQIKQSYELYLGRTPSDAEIKAWQDTGAPVERISQDIRNSPEAGAFATDPKNFDKLIDTLYQEHLGRKADAEGKAAFKAQLASGVSAAEVSQQINQSLEGQNYDTQLITSLYRQNLARNPEQAGFQWWLSMAQDAGYTPTEIQGILQQSATVEQAARNIAPGTAFTNMQLAALEADPYGGRYATQSIYDLLPNAVNTSTIGNRTVQFVAPPTQQMVSSNYGAGGTTWSQTTGKDVLNQPAVQAAISRALASGTMNQADLDTLTKDLTTARNQQDLLAAFNKPQGQVVIDAIYGQQTGEAKTLAEAQAEARQRQAVLSAQDPGYYQSNMALADAYRAAGLNFPFGPEAYQGYDTRVNQANLLTQQNFNEQVNKLISGLTQQFGAGNTIQTPLTGQYYSETGLQPGFTPIGTEGTTFRSGVAGYTPNLPTGFQFGAPPVNATFQQYRPGAFQPEGVTTGGFITGYDANQQPIFSTYSNPNVNVGGVTSVLNPFDSLSTFGKLMADYQAKQAAIGE